MGLWGGMIFRAGITWGIVAIVLAILGTVLSPILPVIEGLTLATFAFIMAGVHYGAKTPQGDLLSGGLGGALAGAVAATGLVARPVGRGLGCGDREGQGRGEGGHGRQEGAWRRRCRAHGRQHPRAAPRVPCAAAPLAAR